MVIMLSIAESIRNPSMSTLTMPAFSNASLSHCTTVLSAIVAGSSGSAASGGPDRIIPPLWMPRWRGKLLQLWRQSQQVFVEWPRPVPKEAARASASAHSHRRARPTRR